jgi:hypothetical protein
VCLGYACWALIAAGWTPLLLQAPASAVGFRVAVQKWLVLVRLLLGEVPDRVELSAPDTARQLAPYFALAAAVRGGDLAAFRWGGRCTHAAPPRPHTPPCRCLACCPPIATLRLSAASDL